MTTYKGVTIIETKSSNGRSSIMIMAAEIDGGDFGLGVTERDGIEMRQIDAELDVKAARELHAALGIYLQQHEA